MLAFERTKCSISQVRLDLRSAALPQGLRPYGAPRRSVANSALRPLAPATVASFRCNPLEGLSRPSKPPATYSISEVHADF